MIDLDNNLYVDFQVIECLIGFADGFDITTWTETASAFLDDIIDFDELIVICARIRWD